MRVKMKHNYAGPHGTCDEGRIIDLPEAHARALVDSGEAICIPETAVKTPGEDTTRPIAQLGETSEGGSGKAPRSRRREKRAAE